MTIFDIFLIGLLTAVIVIIPAIVYDKIHHYWYIALAYLAVYITLYLLFDKYPKTLPINFMIADNTNQRIVSPSDSIPGNLYVEPGTFTDSTENYYGTEIPIAGPLDGLKPGELNIRLDYLYQKTAYPYKPLTYFEFKSGEDTGLSKSGLLKDASDLKTFRQEMERWYPNTNENQLNTRDCTNWPAGHALSCNQDPGKLVGAPPDIPGTGSGLLDDELNYKKERFEAPSSAPKQLVSGQSWPALFKSAPGNIELESTRDVTGDLCHNCKTGYCVKGYCGSRVLEPGNNNIIDPENYVADYLRDVAWI